MGRIREGLLGPRIRIARLVPPGKGSTMWTTERMYDRVRLNMTWDELGALVAEGLESIDEPQ